MIPMINIVFLLLIFFMVAGSIDKAVPQNLSLPVSATGSAPIDAQLLVSLSADGVLTLNGETKTASELEAEISANLVTAETLSLLADKDVSAKQLDNLLQLFRDQGIANIRMRVDQ
jgi:biopolymer transport protein ExbD